MNVNLQAEVDMVILQFFNVLLDDKCSDSITFNNQ